MGVLGEKGALEGMGSHTFVTITYSGSFKVCTKKREFDAF